MFLSGIELPHESVVPVVSGEKNLPEALFLTIFDFLLVSKSLANCLSIFSTISRLDSNENPIFTGILRVFNGNFLCLKDKLFHKPNDQL